MTLEQYEWLPEPFKSQERDRLTAKHKKAIEALTAASIGAQTFLKVYSCFCRG